MASSENEKGAKPDLTPGRIEALIADLQSPKSHVRWNTAYSLGKMGASATVAVPALLNLLKDNDSAIRYTAAYALGSMGPAAASAAPALVNALKDREAVVRVHAASALGRMDSIAFSAVPALIEALRDENSDVRGVTVYALEKIVKRAKKNAPKMETAELKTAITLWQNAQIRLNTIDGASMPKPVAFERQRVEVQRMVEALQAAQAGNAAPGSSR